MIYTYNNNNLKSKKFYYCVNCWTYPVTIVGRVKQTVVYDSYASTFFNHRLQHHSNSKNITIQYYGTITSMFDDTFTTVRSI